MSGSGWPALRAVPLFAALGAGRLRAMWAASVPRRYAAGEVLRVAGEPARHLLVLLDGRVSAAAPTANGRVVRFGSWAGPCALDKVALLDGAGHTATFTALSACTVRAVPREAFLGLIDDSAAVRSHVLRVLARQSREQQRRLTDTATLPAEARLAAWLLDDLRRHGRVALPGTQQDLADQLGVTRVTVSRCLSRLRGDGLIGLDGDGTVRILAPELLALRARP